MNKDLETEVVLEKNKIIGRGRDRACYLHPLDPDKVIKVSIVENDKQSRREPGYYTKLKNRNINWDAIARFHGKIPTNLGEGLVFDLVKDFDGSTSKSITYYLENRLISQEQINSLLSKIKDYLHTNIIISRDISANNLLYKRETETIGKLVIIDGLGNSELIPLSNFFDFLAQKKISRKWSRLMSKLKKDFPTYNFNL